ncbi:MAG: molybdenum cofactor biosynthesis protein MoaE [Flavobacteriales bacterium]
MITHFSFSHTPITAEIAREHIRSASTGAEVCFVGTVRPSHEAHSVVQLEFEAYEPMALKELEGIAQRCRSSWPVEEIVLVHRLGIVPAREIAVVLWVLASHRKEAFLASAYFMDELKRCVPIWKKEVYSDGSAWVSSTP